MIMKNMKHMKKTKQMKKTMRPRIKKVMKKKMQKKTRHVHIHKIHQTYMKPRGNRPRRRNPRIVPNRGRYYKPRGRNTYTRGRGRGYRELTGLSESKEILG